VLVVEKLEWLKPMVGGWKHDNGAANPDLESYFYANF
jgi:hypothetical protein